MMSTDTVVLLLLQLAAMLAVTLVMGRALRRVGLPALVGELIGGVLLGPTVMGLVAPGAHDWLFPVVGPVNAARDGLIQFGLVLFLFLAGLEVELKHLSENRRTIVLTSLFGVAVPFAVGVASVLLWPDLWQMTPGKGAWVGPLFVGTILSISAIPVIARILMDLGLIRTPFGSLVLAAATIDDLIGWTLFGIILSQFEVTGAGAGSWGVRLLLFTGLSALIFSIGAAPGRRVLKVLMRWFDKGGSYVQLILLVVLLSAAVAEWIGTHAIFGAFLVGVAVARTHEPRKQAYAAMRAVTLEFFVPLYLVSIGLRTNFATNFDPLLVVVVLLVASFGKLAGAALGAWLGGRSVREATAIGFALNARGAMGIVLTSVALDYELINERVFVALIFMAVATSALGSAAISRILRGREPGTWTGEQAAVQSNVRMGV
ncbi:MAG: cation:proton antiporter [Gemmatimonadota bacterium]